MHGGNHWSPVSWHFLIHLDTSTVIHSLLTTSRDIRLPMAVACPSDLLPKLFNLALRLVPILDGKERWESADGGWIFRGTMAAMSRFWVDWQWFTKLWKLCLIMYWKIIKCQRVIFLLQFFHLRPHLQSLIYIGSPWPILARNLCGFSRTLRQLCNEKLQATTIPRFLMKCERKGEGNVKRKVTCCHRNKRRAIICDHCDLPWHSHFSRYWSRFG